MEITLEKIELVKDRTGVSYKEAKEALEAADGSVVDAIIAIEETVDVKPGAKANEFAAETVAKIKELVKKGNVSKISVKKGDESIVNIPVNVGVVGAIVAPWGVIAAAVAAFGFKCKIELTTTDGKVIDVSGKAEDFASDVKEKGAVVFDGMMAKGTDVVQNVKEKAPIVVNDVASEVAGTYDKIKDAAADKYNEFRAKKEAFAEDPDEVLDVNDEENDAGWGEFCEKVEDFCDHIGETAGDLTASAVEKAADAAEQIGETLTDAAEEIQETSEHIKERSGFWSIFSGKKKDEKEETAAAKTDTAALEAAAADEASEKPAE